MAMTQSTPDRTPVHPNVAAVDAVLAAFGAVGRVQLLPDAVTTAALAAAALGVEVGQIANSLIFEADGGIPHAVSPTTYDELLRITGGMPAEVA